MPCLENSVPLSNPTDIPPLGYNENNTTPSPFGRVYIDRYPCISMSLRRFPTEKVLVTLPKEQIDVIDGLVNQGAAQSRSALLQQIIGAFVAETNKMRKVPQIYNEPQTIENAFEALISYFLYSLGKAAIDALFEGAKS